MKFTEQAGQYALSKTLKGSPDFHILYLCVQLWRTGRKLTFSSHKFHSRLGLYVYHRWVHFQEHGFVF